MYGVVKIGGALFGQPGREKLEQLEKFIGGFKGNLAFVSGAGPKAKEMLQLYRKFGLTEGFLDHLGIELTHVNARALARVVGGVYCRDFPAVDASRLRKPVTGGQVPGQSTDAVAAELADFLGADTLVLVKDVGGIYTSDPKEDPGARVLHKVGLAQLEELAAEKTRAGHYGVLDPQALHIIGRSGMKTHVVGPDFDFAKGTLVQT